MRAPGMSWVIPYICVSNVQQSLDFYQAAFGFETIDVVKDEEGTPVHGEMRYQDMVLMVGLQGKYSDDMKTPNSGSLQSPISIYVYVEKIDEFYQSAIRNGAESVGEPEDMFWGDRCCRVQDKDGYIWCFGSHLGN